MDVSSHAKSTTLLPSTTSKGPEKSCSSSAPLNTARLVGLGLSGVAIPTMLPDIGLDNYPVASSSMASPNESPVPLVAVWLIPPTPVVDEAPPVIAFTEAVKASKTIKSFKAEGKKTTAARPSLTRAKGVNTAKTTDRPRWK